MKKYKELRRITSPELRNLCIEYNYYTRGDNEEYEKLLDMCYAPLTLELAFKMAENIMAHSVMHSDIQITDIVFLIINKATTYIEEEGKEIYK